MQQWILLYFLLNKRKNNCIKKLVGVKLPSIVNILGFLSFQLLLRFSLFFCYVNFTSLVSFVVHLVWTILIKVSTLIASQALNLGHICLSLGLFKLPFLKILGPCNKGLRPSFDSISFFALIQDSSRIHWNHNSSKGGVSFFE